MPLTSSVVNQLITNFKLYCCSKKFQMSQKNVKSLLEQLKVCIFAEIVFGVRCALNYDGINENNMKVNRGDSICFKIPYLYFIYLGTVKFVFSPALLKQDVLLIT